MHGYIYIQILIFLIFKFIWTPYIFEYLRLIISLKDDPVTIQTSVFQKVTVFNYSVDILFENFYVSKSKFKQVVFELYNFAY